MIKMVVSDLDGTLLNDSHQLNPETIATIIKLQQQGIKFVIASGRNYYSLTNMIKKLEIAKYQGFVIGSNGQQLYDFANQKMYTGAKMTSDGAYRLRQICYHLGLNTIIMYDHQTYYTTNFFIRIFLKFKFILNQINKNVDDVGFQNYQSLNVKTKIPGDCNKICLLTKNTKKLQKLNSQIGPDYDLLTLDQHWHEIMVKGVNKGVMLNKIQKLTGFKDDEIMVFGDGENDLEMLSLVKYSYAMSNAVKKAKEAANYQALSNSENGVVKIIEQEIFPKQ